jgi:hypothetical protein
MARGHELFDIIIYHAELSGSIRALVDLPTQDSRCPFHENAERSVFVRDLDELQTLEVPATGQPKARKQTSSPL